MNPSPLHILQTCFSSSWGGLEMQTLEISRALLDRGHIIRIGVFPASRLHQEADRLHLPTLPLAVHGYVHPLLIWRLSRHLLRSGVHLVHCQHSRDIATVVPAVQLSGRRIPIILSKRMGSYISKKDFFHRYTYRRLARVLAISNVIHRNVIATTPVEPSRVSTLHDAVDLTRFHPVPGERDRLRSEFGIAANATVIGFVGRFSPGKGHEEFLGAARILRQRRDGLRFVIVGDASRGEEAYAQGIRAMASTLRVDDLVVFAGYRPDIPAVMSAFDILAFPSHAESFGVVLIEAMAAGLPVVSTNCDGVVDIVADGITGIMVPRRDADAFAGGLERLVDDPELRRRMGAGGRERVERLFDQSGQITQLEALYRELLLESIT